MKRVLKWLEVHTVEFLRRLWQPASVGWAVRVGLMALGAVLVRSGRISDDDLREGVGYVVSAVSGLWSLGSTTKKATELKETKAENADLKAENVVLKHLTAEERAGVVARMNAARRELLADGVDPDDLEEPLDLPIDNEPTSPGGEK